MEAEKRSRQFTAESRRDDNHVQRRGVHLADRGLLETVGPVAWLHLQTRVEGARRLHPSLQWPQLHLQNGTHRIW